MNTNIRNCGFNLLMTRTKFRIGHKITSTMSMNHPDALKNLRKTDDIIVNTINSAVPTHSFHADATAACKTVYDQLEDCHQKREKLIKNCITYTTNNLKRLKTVREANAEDVQLSKQLRAEQTKLRMLQVELSVEDLIRQRSSKVFNDRCRTFFKPPASDSS